MTDPVQLPSVEYGERVPSSAIAHVALVVESLVVAWVLVSHVPGLTTSAGEMPLWQSVAIIVSLAIASLPVAAAVVRRTTAPLPNSVTLWLIVGVGAGLWIVALGLHATEYPPLALIRVVVAMALFCPLLLLPALVLGNRRKALFLLWMFIGTYGLCEVVVGTIVQDRAWRIMVVEDGPYARTVEDGRRFYVSPGARWSHIYSSDPEGYFGDDHRIDYVANEYGFRGPSVRSDKPEGVFRVLAMGDSFTLGEGVREEDTWPRVLETVLRERADREAIEVINAGVSAYDTTQELEQYRRLGRRFDPDVVILAMVWNDAHVGDPGAFTDAFPLSTATLAQYLPMTDRIVRAIAGVFGYTGVETRPEAWAASFDALESLAEEVDTDGGRFVVAIYPSVRHLENESLKRVYEMQASQCQVSGIPIINTYPLFASRSDERWYVHAVDNHPNAAAHRLFAEAIADRVLRMLSVDGSK